MAQLFGSLAGVACALQLMRTYGTGCSAYQGVHGKSLIQIQSKQDSDLQDWETELWTETKLANMTVSADPKKCYMGLFAGKKCQSSGGIYLISPDWYSGHLGGAQTIQRLCGKVSQFWTSLNPAHKGYEVALMLQQDLDNRAFFVASLDCAGKNSTTVMPTSSSRTPMVPSTSALSKPPSSTSTSMESMSTRTVTTTMSTTTVTVTTTTTTTTVTTTTANSAEYPRGSAEDARFLIQASFGPTRESLRNLGNLSYESWIQEQVMLPPSLHRSFYRERANPHLLGARSNAGGSRGACEPGSRWQAFAFSLKDLGKYITVSQGKIFVSASANETGFLRTELDPERTGNGFSLDNSSGWRMKDTVCASEGQQCECTGLVKFGAASEWSTWGYVAGQIACRVEVFGDPSPGKPKHCVCRTRQEATIEVLAKICYVEEFFNGRVKFCKPDTGGVDAGDVIKTVGNPYIWFPPSHPTSNDKIDNLRFQILRPGVMILATVKGKCELGDFLRSDVENSEGRHYLHDPRVKLLTNDLNLPGQSSAARSFVNEESCVLVNGLLRCGSPGETANNPWKGHQAIFHAGEASPPSVASPPLDVDLTGEFSNVFADRVFDFPHGPALWDVPPESARSSVWLMQSLYADDQLRQRVAWALSQILVTSAQGTDYGLFSEMWMSYYDIFVRHGLSNFRDVLREVTYSPVMGMYLTSLKNKAFDASQTRPNENFAREIMQLFTIGEWRLNPDGTPMLGEDGKPLQAYENEHIMSLSRVFTGFDTQKPRSNLEVPMGDFTNFIDPMQMRADWHDAHPKIALDGGYLGDGYPQCRDLSSHAHLSKGARYVIRSEQQPKEITSILQDSQGLAAGWKPVDGGAGRACRGASEQDNLADYYVLHAGLTSIDDCRSKCAETQSCRGIEHNAKSGRCEVWTRNGGIQASIPLPGFTCLSYDMSARSTTTAVPGQIDGVWEPVDGGVDRVCRGATDEDNNDSYFILHKNMFSLDGCKSKCARTPRCQGIEHNRVAGRCELWTRAEGIEASANVAGYTCLRFSTQTTKTTTTIHASQTVPHRIGGTLLAQSGTLLFSSFCSEAPCKFSPVVTLQEQVSCKDADCGILFATSIDVENVIYDYQPPACVHPYFHDGATVVIDEEGSVSLLGEESNKVKVYWHVGAPPQCPSTCISSNSSCTCSAAVRRAPVFSSTPDTASLERLKVSSYTPNMTCTKNCNGDVKVYSATGAFDEDSVFEHEDVLFKNVEEVVDLGGWTFRNPPNFMPPSGANKEVRTKAALDEVESVLDVLFHHPNTPVFIAHHLIQRLVSSNPSRQYIQAVGNAFKTGKHEGKVYTGLYGDLAATAAAVLLHPEARGAGPDAAGKLREPLLKVLHFMRSLEFQEQPGRLMMMKKLEKIISQFPYESPSVFNYYLPSYAIEARSSNNNGGWIRIMHCDGPSSSNRFDFSHEKILQMAAAATRVKICTKGDPGDCVVSQPNSFPINMLRQGKGVSHNDRSTCNAKCVSKTWANTGRDRLSHLWSRCGSLRSFKDGRSSMYWACGNVKGLHLDARDRGHCSWTYRGSDELEVFIDGVSSNDSSYILYRSGASSCPLGFAPVAEDRCLAAVSALRGTAQNMSSFFVGSWNSTPSGCSVQVVTNETAYTWAAYYNSYLYADNGGDFIPVCQKSENVSVKLVAPELEIFDTPNVVGFTDAMLAMVEDQSLSSCNKGFGIESFGCGSARPMNYSGTVQEVWDQMDLLLTGRRLGSMKQTLMDTYGSGATSHIEVLGGVSANRVYVSPTANGRDVDLAGFRRPWLIEKGAGNWFTIKISGDVSSDRTYLSTTSDGRKVDVWFRDDRSGRQRWVISKGTGDWFTIRVLGGVRGYRRYLSTNMAGTRAFLHTRDDGSGRQRWKIPAYSDGSDKQNATIDDIRAAQYSIVMTPHFHTLGKVKPLGTRARPPVSLPESPGPTSDYKAVVILFLFGGADTFNMLVPLNCALYDEYVSIRRGVALSPSQLLRIGTIGQACSDFGIHSELPVLKQLYDSKEAAFVTNVGNLVEPTLGRRGARTCPGNFGHSGMQHASQTLVCQEGMGLMHGGGGRMADALTSQEAGVKAVHSFSLAGNQPWSQGENTKRSVVDGNQVNVESDKPGRSQRIIDKLTTIDFSTVYAKEYTDQVDQALNAYKAVLDVFQNAENLLQNASLDYGGIPQLRQVATLIAARQLRQSRRDFFFVGFGGFDNHGNLAANLARRFSSMNVAISAFVSEMKAQNVWDNVLLATQSDFARTLDPNGNMGTDHGWAGQHFLLSGAIKGGRVYNSFPSSLAAGNPADLGRGRLIPEYPYESFMVPIAEWLGVKPNQLNTVFPNLPNFNASAHLIAGLF